MRGPLPLVDGGQHPSNLIHVDNLVEAILAAIRSESGAGDRYFVNETRAVPWRELFDDLAKRLGIAVSFVDVAREEVLPLLESRRKRPGLKDHVRIALSAEFRRGLSQMPLFAWMNWSAARVFEALPAATRQRIRERLRWPVRVEKAGASPPLDDRYVKVQVRRFHHSPQKLAARLGWRPPLSYEKGLETIVSWVRFAGICEP
jgi:nucleoside-diphosphate-sugar epimerase